MEAINNYLSNTYNQALTHNYKELAHNYKVWTQYYQDQAHNS